jgi:hypothetical protein
MTLDEGDANVRKMFKAYKGPFTITKTTQVAAYAERNGEKSSIVRANFNRRPNNWDITVNSPPTPQYTASGKLSLIDGIKVIPTGEKGMAGLSGTDF